MLFTQPIQAVGIAVILSFIFKKYSEDLDEDKDDDGKSLNDYAKWQNFAHKAKCNYKFTSDKDHRLSQLTTKQLREARLARIEQIKVWTYLRDIVINIVFMVFLFQLAYGINGSKSYDYQDVVSRTFQFSSRSDASFDDINRVEDFYKWATEVMAPALRVSTYYNGNQAYYMAGFLGDFSSRLLGYATLRQVRVNNKGCQVNAQMSRFYGDCYPELTLFNMEDESFGYGWSPMNKTYEPPNGMGPLYRSFQYRSAYDLKGSPYQGTYG